MAGSTLDKIILSLKFMMVFLVTGLLFNGTLRAQEDDMLDIPDMTEESYRTIIFGSANRKITDVQYEIKGKTIVITAKFHNSDDFEDRTSPLADIEWYGRAIIYDPHFKVSTYKTKYFKGNDADLIFEFPFENRNDIGQVSVTCGRSQRDFLPIPKPVKKSDEIILSASTTSISDVRYTRKGGKLIVKARFTFQEQPRFLTIPLEEVERYARATLYDAKHQVVTSKRMFFKGLTQDLEFDFKDFDELRDVVVISGIVNKDTLPTPKPMEKPEVIGIMSSSPDLWDFSTKREGGNVTVTGKFRNTLAKDSRSNKKNKPWYFYANEKKKAETDKKLYYVRATGHDLTHHLVSVNQIALTDYEKQFQMTVKDMPDLAYIVLSTGTLRRLFSRYK